MRIPLGLIRMLGLCALAGVLLAGIMAPVAIGTGQLSNQVSDSVDSISADLATTQIPLVTTMTDKNGAPIAYLFDQYRLPVSFNQISPTMTAAIIAVEDRRFYSHAGVDPKSALRAVLSNSSGGNTQGASTITQQYVKNYLVNVVDRNNPAARNADQAQTVARKLREAKIAMQLDQSMSKDDILTGYLNVVAFGALATGPFGIRAAAAAYFNTTPDKLTVPQSALLAGMVNNPTLYNPYRHPAQTIARRNDVINKMVENNSLPAGDAAAAKATPLGVVQGGPAIPSSSCISAAPDAGFFCQYAVNYLTDAGFTTDQLASGGYTIKTTMDSAISQYAKDAADRRVPTTQDGVANTFVVVKPGQTSHDVVAMVANRNYGQNPSAGETLTNLPGSVSDPFGAGSTFKLFTTAAAMEQGRIGLTTGMPNPKTTCFPSLDPRNRKCYSVTNDDATNPDPITLQEALAISPNTAFVNLEMQTGMSSVLNMAYRLGMRQSMTANPYGSDPNTAQNQQRGGYYGLSQNQYFQVRASFTLGVAALSPVELANVGATIASGGVWCPPNPIVSVTDRYGKPVTVNQQPCEQVVTPALANTLMAGMGEDTTTGTSASTASAAHWTRPTAGKTGTTQENESVGFLGMVDGYSASSLIFADGSHPAKICASNPPKLANEGGCAGGFGGTIAAPTFFDTFNNVLNGVADQPLPPMDPGFMQSGNHGPTVPYVVGQQVAAATAALQQAGYQVVTKEMNSSSAKGQIIGQTPQGNVGQGTQITLFVSSGLLPAPQDSTPPTTGAPGATGTGGG